MKRAILPAIALVLLLAGTGCQVTLTAAVEAERDGSGWVRAGIGLDDEAVRELGDLSRELRLDDLRQAGWDVAAPEQESDGFTWVRAAKRFETAAEAATVAAELSGPAGPFRDVRLERTRSFFKTRLRLTGLVDLTNGLAGLNDEGVQEKLGDADLRIDLDGLRARFGEGAGQAVRARMEALLPGGVEAEAATPAGGDRLAWEPALGEQVQVLATSESWNLVPVVPAAAAVLLVAVALGLIAVRRR